MVNTIFRCSSPLKRFVSLNPLGVQTINFFNPQTVKALNKALLISYYGIRYWDIPKQYCVHPSKDYIPSIRSYSAG